MKQTTTHLLSTCLLAMVVGTSAFAQTPDTAACTAAARAEINLGKSAANAQPRNTAAAFDHFDAALALLDSCGLGQTFDSWAASESMAALFNDTQRFPDGLQYSTAAYELYTKVAPPGHDKASAFYALHATLLHRNNREAEAKPVYEQSMRANALRNNEDSVTYARCLHSISICHIQTDDLDAALPAAERAIALRTRLFGAKHPQTLSSENNLAAIYSKRGDYQAALDLQISNLRFFPKKGGFTIAKAYFNIADDHARLHNRQQSIAAFEIALRLGRENGEQPAFIASTMEALSYAVSADGHDARALELGRAALEIHEKSLPAEHPQLARSHRALGYLYQKANLFEDSYREMALAMAIFEKSGATEDLGFRRTRLLFAQSLRLIGRQDSARQTLRRLLAASKAAGNESEFTGEIWAEMARCELETGRFAAATALLDSALAAARCEYPAQRFRDWNRCAEYHHLKAQAFARQAERGTAPGPLLKNAVESSSRALGALQNERYQLEADESRLARGEETREVFEAAISTALAAAEVLGPKSGFAATAFGFAEQAKSRTIFEALQNARALHDARLPDSLLRRERQLRVDLAFAEKQRRALESTDGPEALALDKKCFAAQEAEARFLTKLEREFPAYFQMKYDLKTVSVAEIQGQMPDERTGMLSFFEGDSAVFVFLVRKNALEHREIPLDFPLEQWVADFRKGISGYHTARKKTAAGYRQTCDQYARTAQKLYQKLLAPFADALPDTLVILPDGVLNYLPFEALLTDAPPAGVGADNFQNWPFLLKTKTLRYGSSATLLQQLRAQKFAPPASESLLALAPFSDKSADTSFLNLRHEALVALSDAEFDSLRFGLNPLPFSKKEAQTAVELFGGEALYGPAATVAAFQKSASRYRTLLLATHAKADDDSAFLLFANKNGGTDSLFARDIHELNLRADLVALSACQTGIGRLRYGEGLISLARAFTYAGAKSILTTLWSVEDASHASLSVGFFQHFKAGFSKTAALRLAKLEYLKNTPGQGGHPFFWAGMVLFGE